VTNAKLSRAEATQLRGVARDLFLNGEDTLEDIALRLGLNPNTVSKWSASEGWGELRRSMQMGDSSLAVGLARQLKHLQEKADKQGVLGSQDADTYLKLTKAYKELQAGQSFGAQVRTLTECMRWMNERAPEVARAAGPLVKEYSLKLAKEGQGR
jgi:hypothetical protein